jgi:drug/metabolite transporter (DMT)-like permease
MPIGVRYALVAAFLFGASVPVSKILVSELPPITLAGLFYLGSGIGLGIWWLMQGQGRRTKVEARISRKDWPWLSAAILSGGVLAPILLMIGLVRTSASSSSLLLNLEGVFTAGIAWFIFKENFDRRILVGMLSIVIGGILLSLPSEIDKRFSWSALLIVGACVCWGLDNNLTRKVSGSDPVQSAALKGLFAGAANLLIGFIAGEQLPRFSLILEASALGFLSYGISLVCFVLALRHLGSARTGAYFSTAPFIGVALSLIIFRESSTALFWIAAGLMGLGVWLHLTEDHRHEHVHEEMEHEHLHVHDEHHQHEHLPTDPVGEPHSHPHRHSRLVHTHSHYPDIHHTHSH